MERRPGWDVKAISEVANRCYNGYVDMFEQHGWPERGNKLAISAPKHVKEVYGSVEKFLSEHKTKM